LDALSAEIHMAADAEPRLEDLVCQLLETPPDKRTTRLESLCAQFPGRATGLREHYAWLAGNGMLSGTTGVTPTAGEPASMPERFGQYRVHGILGRGGMGIVYAGTQPALGDRPVAIKVLRQDLLARPRSEARFVREAMLAARLEHPNLCAVLDVGNDGGQPFLVMPHIAGDLLSARLARRKAEGKGPLPWREVVGMVEKLARALHHAHGRGLVHRDVKPGNIMLRGDGEPVLLDFGLARDLVEADEALTMSRDLVGTPAYMAPEQVERHGRIDARTDVHALAVTAFEAATLRLPYHGASTMELLRAVAAEPAMDLRRCVRDVPRDLAVVLATALSIAPAQRYVDAGAFADDLARVAHGQPILARRPGPLARALRWMSRNRMASALIALLTAGPLTLVLLTLEVHISEHTAAVTAMIEDARRLLSRQRNGEGADLALAARAAEASPRTLGVLHEAMVGLCDRAFIRGRPAKMHRETLSPDGRHIAIHGDTDQRFPELGSVCVYDLARPAAPLFELRDAGPNSAWPADDAILVAHTDGTVSRRRLDGSVVWRTERLGNIVQGIAVQGDRVAVGCGQRGVVLLDAAAGSRLTERCVDSEPDPASAIMQIGFMADGKTLVAVSQRKEPDNGRHGGLHLVPIDGAPCRMVEPVLGSMVRLEVASTGCALLWDKPRLVVLRPDGSLAARFGLGQSIEASHRFPVTCFRFSPDGTRLALGSEATCRFLDLASLELSAAIPQPSRPNNLEFTADGRDLLTLGDDSVVRRLDRQLLAVDALLHTGGAVVFVRRATPDVFVVEDLVLNALYVLRFEPGVWARQRVASGQVQVHVGWTRNGDLVTSARGSGGELRRTGPDGAMRWRQPAGLASLRMRPDGSLGIVQQEKGVVTTLTADSEVIATGPGVLPQGQRYANVAVDVDAGGRRIVLVWQNQGGTASEVAIFEHDGAGWQRRATREDADAIVAHAAFLADGAVLLSCADGTLRRVAADLGEPTDLYRHQAGLRFAAVAGSMALVTAVDGAALLVDLGSGACHLLRAGGPATTAAAIRGDGRRVAVGDAAGEIAIWSLPERALVARFEAHKSGVDRLAFAPDGKLLASGAGDGTVVLWPVDPAAADALARERIAARTGSASRADRPGAATVR
jgi:WD40 repeat protein